MTHRYSQLAFTDAVKLEQTRMGSRAAYQKREVDKTDQSDRLGPDEKAFIEGSDSFYMATVSETGWPYIQHRGGPKGFIKLVDDTTLGFADFRGNRQYVSVGNLAGDDRVSLFFMDYPNRARLKLFAHAKQVSLEHSELADLLVPANYKAKPEHLILLQVEAFDWNCPQHITPRYSQAEIEVLAAMQASTAG